ncbi:MAG: M15 family metallopeptidase, partial [Coriobacteriales bacterium]|nr:M15 family metallopeptidase [Coriobacteriales bacterium]
MRAWSKSRYRYGSGAGGSQSSFLRRYQRRRQLPYALRRVPLGAVVFALVALVLVGQYVKSGNAVEWPEAPQGRGAETPQGAHVAGEDPFAPFRSIYYCDEARVDRYQAFAAANPDLSADEVAWMVECDLDEAPYADTGELADPSSMQAFVNKRIGLPPGYIPPDLVFVDGVQMRAVAAAALDELIAAAEREGLQIWATSGFRSYETQEALYAGYVAQSGQAAADRFSARAGFSEHQTGLAVDINNVEEPPAAEMAWLAQHAHE